MGGEAAVVAKSFPAKAFLIAGVVLILLVIVGVALQRELSSSSPSAATAFTGGLGMAAPDQVRPLGPEQERYALALWPIHSEVKLAAVRMIFAGLAYKTEHRNAQQLKAKVQPLTGSFTAAAARLRQITPPRDLEDAHRSYLEALDLYASAAREMIKAADDGRDEHLVAAQERSERASTELLKLSDVLWPGEYKPN